MSKQEVEAIIGIPPGNYGGPKAITGLGAENEEYVRFWHGDCGKIAVWFNADGTVNDRSYTPRHSWINLPNGWA